MADHASPGAAAQRARMAVAATFALNGLLFGSFAARLPAIRDRLGLSDGEQGLALACLALGAVVAMPVAGALVARVGSRRVTRVAIALACLGTGTVALAGSLPALCALTAVMGAASGALDVAMNAHGVAVERRYGRPILASFHAFFSLGGLTGGALSVLAAALDVDVRVQLAVVASLAAVVGLAWTRWLLPADEDVAEAAERLLVRPPARLLTLGAIAFCCLLIEGAAADWSAVYLHEHAGASAAAAAIGFTSFSVTMTLARFGGDRLVAWLGPQRLLLFGGLLTAVGFGLALALGGAPAGIAGFACVGAGMAGVFPVVLRVASGVSGISPGIALAAVTTTGYLGFIAGPALIGGVAALIGLRAALVIVVALALVVAAFAPAVRGSPVAAAR